VINYFAALAFSARILAHRALAAAAILALPAALILRLALAMALGAGVAWALAAFTFAHRALAAAAMAARPAALILRRPLRLGVAAAATGGWFVGTEVPIPSAASSSLSRALRLAYSCSSAVLRAAKASSGTRRKNVAKSGFGWHQVSALAKRSSPGCGKATTLPADARSYRSSDGQTTFAWRA
jgi:hypothetical protein